MAIPRKLTQEQEREVALAYLCGVDTEKIGGKYAVSDATIRGNIFGKRSREWNDPLVEFYRETNPYNRSRNAVHLFLAFQSTYLISENLRHEEQKLAPLRAELVDVQRDQAVKDIVEEALYHPGIDQIVKWTALDHYVSPEAVLDWATTRIGEPELGRGNPYETLLNVTFGPTSAEGIVRVALTKRLSEEYGNGGPSSLQKVFLQVAYDIIQKVKEGGLGITPAKKKAIDEILQTLTERDRQVIGMRFGLDGYDGPKDLDRISQEWSVTEERVRQVEAKAIRRLRHPSRSRRLVYIKGLVTEQDAQNYLDNLKMQSERDRWRVELYSEIEQDVLGNIARDPALRRKVDERRQVDEDLRKPADKKVDILSSDRLNDPVEELEFSVRTSNCLFNLGIKTIGDLARLTEVELLRCKNFGRRSLRELEEALKPYNIKLARGK